MVLETNRLILRTNCIIENGNFMYPEFGVIDILNPTLSSAGANSGFAVFLKENMKPVAHIDIFLNADHTNYLLEQRDHIEKEGT